MYVSLSVCLSVRMYACMHLCSPRAYRAGDSESRGWIDTPRAQYN